MNAVIAGREKEAALGIEDRGKTKHSKRGSGCRRKRTCGVVTMAMAPPVVRVCGTHEDEQHGQEETDPGADRTLGDTRRQTTSGVRAEGLDRHLSFLVANRRRVEGSPYEVFVIT